MEIILIINVFVIGFVIGFNARHYMKSDKERIEKKPKELHKVVYREMKCGFMDINAN